jgi:PPM family protein phosphatase
MKAHETQIDATGGTDRGRRRVRNEDAFGVFPEIGLFAVADGVGGRLQGDVASERAIEEVSTFLGADRTWPMEAEGKRDDLGAHFVAAVKHANERIHLGGHHQPKEQCMATTFAGILVDHDRACIAHVGDSRVYRLREHAIEALTDDHSLANELIRRAVASSENAEAIPNGRALARALGLKETVEVSVRLEALRMGDVFLACTDGLHGVVSASEITEILAEMTSAGAAVDRLIACANAGGGPDNVTAVVLRVESPGMARGAS